MPERRLTNSCKRLRLIGFSGGTYDDQLYIYNVKNGKRTNLDFKGASQLSVFATESGNIHVIGCFGEDRYLYSIYFVLEQELVHQSQAKNPPSCGLTAS